MAGGREEGKGEGEKSQEGERMMEEEKGRKRGCKREGGSLATSPSPPGRSSGRVAKPRAEGGEGLANIALDHISLECQLHVPVNR